MAGLINELINVLAGISENTGGLIYLAEEKKKVIIKNDVDALKEITARENVFVGRCQKLERERVVITKDIASVLNIREEDLTLKKLGEVIKDQSEYGEFSEVSAMLTDKLRNLREINGQNRVLIENALDYIEYSVNVMRSTYSEDDSFMDDKRRQY